MKLFRSLLLNILLVLSVSAQVDISSVTELEKEIALEKDLLYELFIADKNYLCWTEFYTNKIFALNLETFTTSEIKLTKGRGPHEYLGIAGMESVDGILYIYDPANIKFLRIDLQSMEYLDDIPLSRQAFSFKSFGDRFIGVASVPNVASITLPYLYDIKVDQKRLIPLDWTGMNKSYQTSPENFSAYYKMNEQYFLRVGRRMNHLVVANFEKKVLSEHTYDELYRKQESFNPNSENLTQVLSFYIHDAEIGKKNKLYLLAEGRTNTKRFYKNELTILDLETMEYMEETIKLPKDFDKIVITEKYFIGFKKDEFSLNIYTYE